jgi:oligosaccharide repeat unit polymerase
MLAVDHRLPSLGVWVLVAMLITMQVGSLLAETCERQPELTAGRIQSQSWMLRRARSASILLLIVALISCVIYVDEGLNVFHEDFSFMALLAMGAKWTLLRYDGFVDPWPIRIAAIWFFPPSVTGGILFALSEKRLEKFVGIATLLPALLLTLLTGGRTGFLVGLACWLSAYWASRIAIGNRSNGVAGIKTGMLLVTGAAGLFLLFLVVDAFRGIHEDTNVNDVTLQLNRGQVVNYLFGSPAAFAEWYVQGDRGPLGWGSFTLPGAFDVLRIRARTLGTYTDSAQTVGLEGTNIFTVFRGLIEDFGFGGAFLVCACAGFASARAFSNRSLSPVSLLGLAAFYTAALFSPLMFIFGFNGPIFAWFIAWLVLRFRQTNGLPAN